VVFGVDLGGFFGVMFGVETVGVGHGRVMRGLVMFAFFVLFRGVEVMFGSLGVMFRSLLMMLGAGVCGHYFTPKALVIHDRRVVRSARLAWGRCAPARLNAR
jgi:hypothetical protein